MGEFSHYANQPAPRRNRRKKLITAAIVLLLLAGGGLAYSLTANRTDDTKDAQVAKPAEEKPQLEAIKGKYIFSGTIVLSRAVENAALTPDGYDHDQPFSKLDTMNYDQYDAGIIDMECPSTNRRIPYDESVRSLTFSCHPDWFPSLKKYYQIANVASNHTYDMGEEGFEQTVDNLDGAGIQSVGHYSPRIKEDICEVVSLPVRIQKSGGGEEKAALPVALCAFHYQFHLSPEPGEIEVIKDYAKTMPVIGLMHAGVEYTRQPIPLQQEIARKMIDYGAEFVVGNGAHWVQSTEVYKDKLIVYSTGNFIFDQLEYETRLGLSLSAEMTIPYGPEVEQWLELADECVPREDSCQKTAEQRGLSKLAAEFTFDAIGSFGGYEQVTQQATAVQQEQIEQRANWSQTKKQLGQ
jgi:poly-gamma-glutamate synthesis protein (capsule biosynthesis protein)